MSKERWLEAANLVLSGSYEEIPCPVDCVGYLELDEFVAGGSQADDVLDFLSKRGGGITRAASDRGLDALQARLDAYNATAAQPRVIHPNDACIAAAACEAGVPLITRDGRLFRIMGSNLPYRQLARIDSRSVRLVPSSKS